VWPRRQYFPILISGLGKMIDDKALLRKFATRSMAPQLLRVNEDVVGKVKFLQTRDSACKLARIRNGRRAPPGQRDETTQFLELREKLQALFYLWRSQIDPATTAAMR